MLNKAILMGRFVRDPELRHTQANNPVCSFSLAIERDRKDGNGDKQTDFIDCVAWNKTAEFVSQWFTKGMMAIAVGRIQSRNWEDKNGSKRVTIEVNCDDVSFGETKKSREGSDSRAPHVHAEWNFDLPSGGDFAELSDDDDPDEVPF